MRSSVLFVNLLAERLRETGLFVNLLAERPRQTGLSSHRNTHRNRLVVLVKSHINQIVFTSFRLILNQTELRLDQNQPENNKYYPVPVY